MSDWEASNALIIEIVRGKVVESRHFVSLAAVDSQKRLRLAFGDMVDPVYMRSSAKPFQALPLVEKKIDLQHNLSTRQLALICASHAGTDEHAEVASSILNIAGLSETSLRCGTHTPYDQSTAKRLLKQGESLSALRHNCSGKHAGMLLLAQALNQDPETYLDPHHRVQAEILQAFSAMVDIKEADVELGTDGCSAPNFAIPLPAAALGYACLMDPSSLDASRAEACRRITHAMLSNPDIVAGIGEFDTELMQAADGNILSKGGAEGYQALGISSANWPGDGAAGIVLKVQDGDGSKRARSVVCMALLRVLNLITPEAQERLARFDQRALNNFRQIEVGQIRMARESLDRLQEAYERI